MSRFTRWIVGLTTRMVGEADIETVVRSVTEVLREHPEFVPQIIGSMDTELAAQSVNDALRAHP